MALHWTSALSVGVPEIDAQHRELFHRIDKLMDAMLHRDRSEAGRLLAFLREYVVAHFEAEEQVMGEAGYPDAARHAEEHRRFAALVHGVDATFQADGPTAAVIHDLERTVVGWLSDHVYFHDVALGRFVQQRATEATRRAAC